MAEPGERNSPTSTRRIPSCPAKGALICFLSMSACWAVTLAAAPSSRARASSYSDCETDFFGNRLATRSNFSSARRRSATRPSRVARSEASSSWSNRSPSLAVSPESKWMVLTFPATSLVTSIPDTAATLPTALIVGIQASFRTCDTATTGGGGPACAAICRFMA